MRSCFDRVAAVYGERDKLKLDAEQMRLVELDYRAVRSCGRQAFRSGQGAAESVERGGVEAAECVSSSKVLQGTRSGLCDRRQGGAGGVERRADCALPLPQRRRAGRQGYAVPLQNTTQQPWLAELSDRATRQALFEDGWTRNEHGGASDTRETVARLAALRVEKAELLGFPTYAAWKLGYADGEDAGSGAELYG